MRRSAGFASFVVLASLITVAETAGSPLRSALAYAVFGRGAVRVRAQMRSSFNLGFAAATVRLLTDKVAQRTRLRDAGVDAVAHHAVTRPEDWSAAVAAVGLPAVLKPVRGEGSRDTVPVDDEDAGARDVASWFADRDGPLVLEECLVGTDEGPSGDYVSVECAVVDGDVRAVAVVGKLPQLPPFRETGQLWPSHLPAAEQAGATELARRAVAALGVRHGITHTEVKLTASGPRIIEVNGRLGGHGNDLARSVGDLDLVAVAGRIALGEDPGPVTLDGDGVHVQYYPPAPTVPCILRARHHLRAIHAVPGVTVHRVVQPPGSKLPGGVMTTPLDFVAGWTADHAGMWEVLAEAWAVMAFTFELPDGSTARLTDEDLRTLPVGAVPGS